MRNTALTALAHLIAGSGILLAQDQPKAVLGKPELVAKLFDVRSAAASQHRVNLIPAEIRHVCPGALIDMSDPGSPRLLENLRLKCQKTDLLPSGNYFSDVVTTDEMSSSQEETAIRIEASFLSFFGARTRIDSSRFRKDHVHTVYGFQVIIDGSQAVEGGLPVWDPKFELPKAGGERQARLEEFTLKYGTHYVHRIYHGRTVVFKAVMNERDEKRRKELEVKLKAAFLGFKLNDSGYVEKTKESLKGYKYEFAVAILGSEVQNPQRLYTTDFGTLKRLMDDYTNGRVKVTSAPVGMDVYSLVPVIPDDGVKTSLLRSYEFVDNAKLEGRVRRLVDHLLTQKVEFNYPGNFTGTLRFGELASGTITTGNLGEDGAIHVGDNADQLTFKIGTGGDDLDGKIVIGKNCKRVRIEVADVIDRTAAIVIGDNSDVEIVVGGKTVNMARLEVGANSTVTIPKGPDIRFTILNPGLRATIISK